MRRREATASRELAVQGHLVRLWRPSLKAGTWCTLGLFVTDEKRQMEDVRSSMALRVRRSDEATALPPHPNDPGAAPSRPSG